MPLQIEHVQLKLNKMSTEFVDDKSKLVYQGVATRAFNTKREASGLPVAKAYDVSGANIRVAVRGGAVVIESLAEPEISSDRYDPTRLVEGMLMGEINKPSSGMRENMEISYLSERSGTEPRLKTVIRVSFPQAMDLLKFTVEALKYSPDATGIMLDEYEKQVKVARSLNTAQKIYNEKSAVSQLRVKLGGATSGSHQGTSSPPGTGETNKSNVNADQRLRDAEAKLKTMDVRVKTAETDARQQKEQLAQLKMKMTDDQRLIVNLRGQVDVLSRENLMFRSQSSHRRGEPVDDVTRALEIIGMSFIEFGSLPLEEKRKIIMDRKRAENRNLHRDTTNHLPEGIRRSMEEALKLRNSALDTLARRYKI